VKLQSTTKSEFVEANERASHGCATMNTILFREG
jgi:hypothetical protein